MREMNEIGCDGEPVSGHLRRDNSCFLLVDPLFYSHNNSGSRIMANGSRCAIRGTAERPGC